MKREFRVTVMVDIFVYLYLVPHQTVTRYQNNLSVPPISWNQEVLVAR